MSTQTIQITNGSRKLVITQSMIIETSQPTEVSVPIEVKSGRPDHIVFEFIYDFAGDSSKSSVDSYYEPENFKFVIHLRNFSSPSPMTLKEPLKILIGGVKYLIFLFSNMVGGFSELKFSLYKDSSQEEVTTTRIAGHA